MNFKFRTFSPCSSLETRDLMWVLAVDGVQPKPLGVPEVFYSYEIARLFSVFYEGENLPPVFDS